MERNIKNIMERFDETPMPVAVSLDGVNTPESSEKSVSSFRARLSKTLMIPVAVLTAGTAVMAGDMTNAWQDRDLSAVNAQIDQIKQDEKPVALKRARAMAVLRLFGVKDGAANFDEAQKEVAKMGNAKTLNAEDYLPKGQFEVTEDGKHFIVDGKEYKLVESETEKGLFILAGREVLKKTFLGGEGSYMVEPVVVGGAKKDSSSDLNADGKITADELETLAQKNTMKGFSHHDRRTASR